MLVKKIKYTDFNGQEREEPFYFNLSKAELMEMELTTDGGLDTYIRRIIAQQNNKEIVKLFKELILKSYGERSDDGKRFVKSKELTDAFTQTNAYSELFMELSTNADAAEKFITGVVDPSLAGELKKVNENAPQLVK